MAHRVKIAAWVDTALKQILPPEALRQVYRTLQQELAQDPERYLVRNVVPFADKFSYPVTVSSPTEHPFRWWLSFVVDRSTPGELAIVSVSFADGLDNVQTN